MDASFAGMWVAAGLGGFWALVLGAVLALCRTADRALAPPLQRRNRPEPLSAIPRAGGAMQRYGAPQSPVVRAHPATA